eukprot:6468929-Amphidinium_carterae.1
MSWLGCRNSGFSLASLRSGGATEFMLRTSNLGALQYRGRWSSSRTLQHYLQYGLSATTYAQLPTPVRDRLQDLASLAPSILCPAGIHSSSWDDIHHC